MAASSLLEVSTLTANALWLRNRSNPITSLKTTYNKIKSSCSLNVRRIERGITMDATFDQCLELYHKQNGKCAISGRVLVGNAGHVDKISIDRIDSNLPYSIENIQLVTAQVNRGKMDFQNEDFISMCASVTKFQQKLKKNNG
jgi:CRISPR/Cas system Type II protein with McrA/HNH and RuvC-like nuclease domain